MLEEEGIKFIASADVGGSGPGSIAVQQLIDDNDAVLLATGATTPRDSENPQSGKSMASISPWTSCAPIPRVMLDSRTGRRRLYQCQG